MGKRRKRKSGKKMPANVVNYFKLLGKGVSSAQARKQAGLPPAKKRKAWGPGHPLYDWQHSRK